MLTNAVPMAENVNPVPAATVLALGSVIAYGVEPPRTIRFPEM
jgi:hypothetical protein